MIVLLMVIVNNTYSESKACKLISKKIEYYQTAHQVEERFRLQTDRHYVSIEKKILKEKDINKSADLRFKQIKYQIKYIQSEIRSLEYESEVIQLRKKYVGCGGVKT